MLGFMNIILTAVFGEETKQVILSQPTGGNSGNYYIMIDDHFHGQVNKMLDGWHVYPNSKSWLSSEDCEAILDAVQKNNP